ncbi:NAD(P)/FAD-dependent oxidoreductase [Owenweeksia hongkongensis]|uniref:NAD(P)/FAD-dependent oxidoreductase n=1 Tax=Owenweeksia hongkongensis TaxID=253245 RepID=UPI003A8D1BAD
MGGGLAGLTNAIDLRLRGYDVMLIEKKEYPFHKVCGEYISNEVKPYLQRLGAFPETLQPKSINRFEISSLSGKIASCSMKMGGFGISRYAFDNFLFERASKLGVRFMLNTTVSDVSFENDEFTVTLMNGETFKTPVVIGAFGKRSILDKKLGREFFNRKTDYVGVKHHFKADFPDDLVALHNFEGGYCGLSRVENNHVNLCYLTTTKVFKQYGSIQDIEEKHLSQNPHLKKFFENAESEFEPLVISQVNFMPKKSVENHVLMSGDAAGLIHPLCGNGMAMAIHSAKICSGVVDAFLQQRISRKEMENRYEQEWGQAFNFRLNFGKAVQGMFGKPVLSNLGVNVLSKFPGLLNKAVQLSHGKQVL